jgi:glycosyltransferase involved in cell wall biosynthesis
MAGGGAERSLGLVAAGLAARGAEVSLVLASASGPYLADVPASVRVVDLHSGSVPGALPGLVRHLRASAPDAILAGMNHANVVTALAWRIARPSARLVLSERANLSALRDEYRGLRMRITLALARRLYPWATTLVAVSDGVADDLAGWLGLPRSRITVLLNPVVDPAMLTLSAQPPQHPWLARRDAPVIVAAGRLTAQKGFDTLLHAFALARRERRLRLLILGEGEQRESLRSLAAALGVAEDVDLPGFEPNPFAAMRAASLFVLSSRYEGLPGALIQAMACGTRVVATDCPSGPREILEAGRWGRLVPVGDAAALAAAIGAALDDRAPPDVRARAAAYSVDAAVGGYAHVLGLA